MHRLMICDDEPVLRNGLKSLIEKSDLPVEITALAANGSEALEKILQYKPHIVLMDINMPGLSGLEVIQECRSRGLHVVFIILSGYDDFTYAQQACRLDVMDYLLKPIDKQHLLELIQNAVKKVEQEQLTRHILVQQPQNTAQQILQYIQDHFTDPELSLAQLASRFNLSDSYVTRIIKNETNSTFSALVTHLRLERAIEYLVNDPDMMLVQIAELCGFSSQHYFSRVFKESTGFSPADYRKNILGD